MARLGRLAASSLVIGALLVAIFVSNLPEGIGSASDMRTARRPDGQIVRIWLGFAVAAGLSSAS